ncbi:MAG: hypothetical protein K9M51_03530 [Candidatus Gracilibacteria bacterium]|nr:hypothetical protein [Candidatus Gracilibacteria bacterium]
MIIIPVVYILLTPWTWLWVCPQITFPQTDALFWAVASGIFFFLGFMIVLHDSLKEVYPSGIIFLAISLFCSPFLLPFLGGTFLIFSLFLSRIGVIWEELENGQENKILRLEFEG